MKANHPNKNTLKYISLGTQMMATLALAVWVGMKLDEKIAWSFPVLTILLPLISLIYSLWKIVKEFSKPKK